MQVVQVLVRTEGVHVGVDAASGPDAELAELEPFPFGEGMHNFGFLFVQTLDGEGDGPLHGVQVVVDAGSGKDHDGCGDAQKRQLGGQVALEHVFYGLDGFLGVFESAEQVAVVFGNDE